MGDSILMQVGIGDGSTAGDQGQVSGGTCDEMRDHHQMRPHHSMTQHHHHDTQQQHHHHQIATAASFHNITRPSHPISTIISPPPLHHTSINMLDHDSYNVSRLMLQNEQNFQVIL